MMQFFMVLNITAEIKIHQGGFLQCQMFLFSFLQRNNKLSTASLHNFAHLHHVLQEGYLNYRS